MESQSLTTEIDSERGFRQAVTDAVAQAVVRQARRLVFVDPDFEGWPLEEPALIDALTSFVRLPGRQVVLYGRNFDGVQRRCPRFVSWRRTWGHAIEAFRPPEETPGSPTLVLVDRTLAVHLIEKSRWRGRVIDGGAQIHLLAEELDAFAQRAEHAFAASTLGL
jgi:hypothetical protein